MQQVLHIATFLPFSIPTRLWWNVLKLIVLRHAHVCCLVTFVNALVSLCAVLLSMCLLDLHGLTENEINIPCKWCELFFLASMFSGRYFSWTKRTQQRQLNQQMQQSLKVLVILCIWNTLLHFNHPTKIIGQTSFVERGFVNYKVYNILYDVKLSCTFDNFLCSKPVEKIM